MIFETKQILYCINKKIYRMYRNGGKQTLCTAIATYVLRTCQSPYLIPISGVMIGFSAIHLAYKVGGHYNLRIKPYNILYFRIFEEFPKLMAINLIFAFLIVGIYPCVGLALSLHLGVVMGALSIDTRSWRLENSWTDKLWMYLR